VISWYAITGISSESIKIILKLLEWNARLSVIGVQQEWANLEEPGKKPGLTLILKIRGVNSGDGYRGQEHVVFDEFRGGIDISHVLRWFDRYPVIVE